MPGASGKRFRSSAENQRGRPIAVGRRPIPQDPAVGGEWPVIRFVAQAHLQQLHGLEQAMVGVGCLEGGETLWIEVPIGVLMRR